MNDPRSAYLHIPFCNRRCFYCDFAVVPLSINDAPAKKISNKQQESYVKLLQREILISPKGPPLSTIYFGGGTPSLLTPKQIFSLLQNLSCHYGIQDGAEITMEVDPASFSHQDLDEFINIGINRFSLGGQSFDNQVLLDIGRQHTREQLIQSCNWLNKRFQEGSIYSWSIDLIQNLPGQDLNSWEEALNEAVNTLAPHISIYDLSIEPGTVFAFKERQGLLDLPDEDLAADINRLTSCKLKSRGFSRYEISSYAIPGHVSRHNRVYWSGRGWWGFGMGATSSVCGRRLARPRTIKGYENWLKNQENLGLDFSLESEFSELISFDDLLITGLRRREGFDFDDLARESGWDSDFFQESMESLKICWKDALESGLLIQTGNRFYLSEPYGMDISNQILVQMLIWWESLPSNVVLLSKT